MYTFLLALMLAQAPAWSAGSAKPPAVSPSDQAEADRIVAMPSDSPVARFNQLLEAQKLGPGARFALAQRVPGLVEQLEIEPYSLAVAYVNSLPGPVLGRVRRGETIIRTARDMERGEPEFEAAWDMAVALKIKGPKVDAMRVGTLEGRVIRVEVTVEDKSRTVELAWPSTPERDDASRNALARVFGARPTQSAQGAGAPLPLVDGSFEDPATLGKDWVLERGHDLGGGVPVGEVSYDERVAIDGSSSLRFYGTKATRLFPEVAQRITLSPGTRLRVRAQLKTDNIRVEYQQKSSDLYMEVSFEDISGQPVGSPIRAQGLGETHTWQTLEIQAEAPDGAAYVRIGLVCALSGTAWFDGVAVQIND